MIFEPFYIMGNVKICIVQELTHLEKKKKAHSVWDVEVEKKPLVMDSS